MLSTKNKIVTEVNSGEYGLKKLPSATTSVIYFLVMTITYGFMMIYNTINSTSLSQVKTNASNQIYTLIYVTFLVTGTYFINVNIAKSICNENTIQWSRVFSYTIAPWITVFGILFLLLELFPGWIKPFSNTIGYLIVNTLGASDILKNLLATHDSSHRNSTLKTALENIEKNYTRFINEIDVDEDSYKKFIGQLNKEQFLKRRDNADELYESSDVIKLFALVNIKDIIGKLFWYVLAGSLIASISYNFIVNMNCEKTADQSEREIDKLYENSGKELYGTVWKKIDQPTVSDNLTDYSEFLEDFIESKKWEFIRQRDNDDDEIIIGGGTSLYFPEKIPYDSYIIISDNDDLTKHYFKPTM
tara:strand:+ start:3888 stop:4967 length:1080 start_codon:yes stop_codon:yes gene_type:complete